eukprot:374906_1
MARQKQAEQLELDQYGFKANTFDDAKVSSVLSSTLMRNVNKKMPNNWQTSHKYFIDGYISLILYLIITTCAFYYQLILTDAYQQYLLSPLLAFGALGILGCGHEAKHKAFAPPRTYSGQLVNTMMTFIGLDCLFASGEQWRVTHHIYHHKTVNQWPPDDMVLFGNNWIVETLWSLYAVVRWLYNDVLLAFGMDNYALNGTLRCKWYKKIMVGMGAGLRLLFWGYPAYKHQTMGLIVFTLSWTAVLANYLVFVSHSLPARTKPKTHDYGLLQMRETWDILPQSKIAMFLHVGFGAHVSHHIFGYVPRQLLPLVSNELR